MCSLLVRPEEQQPYHRATQCWAKAPALANGAAATLVPQLLLLELCPVGCLGALTEPGCWQAALLLDLSELPTHSTLAFQQTPTRRQDGKHDTV